MRVKICGITTVDDALICEQAGADAIGLVFYEPSPRCVDIESAMEIAKAVGPFISLVGLFVNADEETVGNICDRMSLDVLQFHGDESRDYCEQFSQPYMKAIRMRDDLDINQAMSEYSSASAILFDAYQKGVPGGTGETFDWERLPKNASKRIVLAGGLNPENVSSAIKQVKPYAVDVSGGVELKPGIKDKQKVFAFIQNAKS